MRFTGKIATAASFIAASTAFASDREADFVAKPTRVSCAPPVSSLLIKAVDRGTIETRGFPDAEKLLENKPKAEILFGSVSVRGGDSNMDFKSVILSQYQDGKYNVVGAIQRGSSGFDVIAYLQEDKRPTIQKPTDGYKKRFIAEVSKFVDSVQRTAEALCGKESKVLDGYVPQQSVMAGLSALHRLVLKP